MSRRVVTVAFGFVPLTEVRHDGQVYGWMDVAVEAWNWNHSFKQAPQKVCRQSRRVRGWYRTSVHIEQLNSFSKSTMPFVSPSAIAMLARRNTYAALVCILSAE